ncbi:MAG: hypothetical protein HUU16_04870 [Candidatus Omnitrophica bacterium]|nr:hypothetical protein [Candidatus Omnitrophota bacterium]
MKLSRPSRLIAGLTLAAAVVGGAAGWILGQYRAGLAQRAREENQAAEAAARQQQWVAELAGLIRSADRVVIVDFDPPPGEQGAPSAPPRQRREVSFSDSPWLERLAAVLASCPGTSTPACLCVAYPEIRLYRGGEVVLSLSTPHTLKLRIAGRRLTGDYLATEEIARAISSLAREKVVD